MMPLKKEDLRPNPPKQLVQWANKAKAMSEEIRSDIERIKRKMNNKGADFDFKLKTYSGSPLIHGFMVGEPLHRSYISFLSWESPNYEALEWGQRGYVALKGGSQLLQSGGLRLYCILSLNENGCMNRILCGMTIPQKNS